MLTLQLHSTERGTELYRWGPPSVLNTLNIFSEAS